MLTTLRLERYNASSHRTMALLAEASSLPDHPLTHSCDVHAGAAFAALTAHHTQVLADENHEVWACVSYKLHGSYSYLPMYGEDGASTVHQVAEITDLFVRESVRHRGLHKALINHVMEAVREFAITSVVVEITPDAEALTVPRAKPALRSLVRYLTTLGFCTVGMSVKDSGPVMQLISNKERHK